MEKVSNRFGKVDLTVANDPKSPVSEAYRTIRTNIQFAGVNREAKIIEITSSIPNEGKSMVIANLAVVMAQAEKKVLLLDCDFRNPTQHKLFQLLNKGLSDCVANGLDFHTILQSVGQENLDILTSGAKVSNPSEILSSSRMKEMLDEAREEYDYILIDTPPVMPVTDSAVLASRVDGVVLVVASGEERPDIVKMAKRRLEQAGANILGCVLNKVKLEDGHYGYGYGK